MTKTPKFSKAIGDVLKDLVPHKKECSQCGLSFKILENDIEFFNKFQVPPPKMCPECRRQRRLAFVNYTTLFKRPCDAFNHDEEIISSIPKGTKFPVFDFDYYWHSDENRKNHSQVFDFKESFFEQFKNLFFISPQPALTRDPASTNSEYSSYGAQMKDCYYIFGGLNAEKVNFGIWALNSKECTDILICLDSDLCYEVVYPDHCYDCNFIYFSRNCLNSSFMYDCRNCTDCFGCVNLRNKKNCIWNKQFSKEEYLFERNKINLGDREVLNECKKNFMFMVKDLPIRGNRNEHSQDAIGNYIVNSKNCFLCMWALNSEDIRYTDFVLGARGSMDCTISDMSESLYEISCVGKNSFNTKFSICSREIGDSEYLMNCKNCKYCFACIGLENKKFCIFNKQYEEKEYWEFLDNLKTKMLIDGEYGEFFPIGLSPFPYNASLSNIVFNIPKEKVLALGGWWHSEESSLPEGVEFIKADEVSLDIKNVSDKILEQGIISAGNGRPFQIVRTEFDFYRRKNLAMPSLTPYERIMARFEFVNNFKVAEDKCFKCGTNILSSYDSKMGYKPYCEKCYQSEVY